MPEQDGGQVPSKSELKRQMTALQRLGETLVGLSDRELARIPIDDEQLSAAIAAARTIRSNSARRRQLQYIGKLMRGIDPTAIAAALEELHQQRRNDAAELHELEALRDGLLTDPESGLQAVLLRFPDADRQHLRALLRQHRKETGSGKPPGSSRKLYRYLRELRDRASATG
jgi:ribosome-associated protein